MPALSACDYRLTLTVNGSGRGSFTLLVAPDAPREGTLGLLLARILGEARQSPMEVVSAQILERGRAVLLEGRFPSLAAVAPADLFARSRCFLGQLPDESATLLQCAHAPIPMKPGDRIEVVARLPCDVGRTNGRIGPDGRSVAWRVAAAKAAEEIRLWALMP